MADEANKSKAEAQRRYPFALEREPGGERRGRVLKALDETLKADPFKLLISLYNETCARCNNCADLCHVYRASGEIRDLPAHRSELVRAVLRRHFTLSGKLLGRLVGARELDEKMVDELLESVYRCSLCRRCNLECPMGIDNAFLARLGRVALSAAALAPKNFTVSVRAQLEQPGHNTSAIPPAAFIDTVEFLNEEIEEMFGRKGLGFPIDKKGAEIFFIAPASDYISEAETLMGCAVALNLAGADWTIGSENYDAINYGLFYNDAVLEKVVRQLLAEVKRLGAKKIIIGECGHATKTAKLFTAMFSDGEAPPVESVLEYTARALRAGKFRLDPEKNPDPVTYHDPCNLGRMGGVMDEPREILRASVKQYVEMVPTRGENYCCGGGGGTVGVPDIKDWRMTVAGKMKAEQLKSCGAKYVAAPCANCKKQLRELVEHYNLEMEVVGVHDFLLKALVFEPQKEA